MQHLWESEGDFRPWSQRGSMTHLGDSGGGCYTNAAGDQQPKMVLPCLWEASWHGLHTTRFFDAAQPGLVLIPLLPLLPLVMGLAVVSMVVVSMGGRFVAPPQICGFLTADLMVVVRMEGVVLVDGGH